MRVTNFFMPTLKNVPAEAAIASHRLMLRAGLIKQMNSGIYSWLPLGLMVLRNLEKIVRQELDQINAIEILMPTIQSADLWHETGRYDAYGAEMLKIKDRHDRDMLYGPTNEEMITDIFRHTVKSYKKLPHLLYHIQWKFRDEIRPRFGVMRAREFLMKDCYSFDISAEKAKENYQKLMLSYIRIFKKMGLDAIPMRADTGPIGGDLSHEFLVLAPTGESEVYYDARLKNIIDQSVAEKISPDDFFNNINHYYAVADEQYDESKYYKNVPEEHRIQGRAIEVGHIFYLGTKYSEVMNAFVVDEQGKDVPVHMGCYGIGVSRLVGALIEAFHDDKGIIWPKEIAPYHIGLINLKQGHDEADAICEKLYSAFHEHDLSVLYHDTKDRAGAKFSDIDLIGLPYQVIIGMNAIKENIVEIKCRKTDTRENVPLDQVVSFLISKFS